MQNSHKCATCGHVWESIDDKTAKDVRTAAQVNGQGPYCGLCMNLEMARRYAEAQGYATFKEAVTKWLNATNQQDENLNKLLEDIKCYIEEMEEKVDLEWGSARSADELIKSGNMPGIYERVMAVLDNKPDH